MEANMSYDSMVEQIKSVPQEYLEEIENYIQYILYRHSIASTTKNKDLSKYFGSVNFPKDGLAIQKELRNEWN